MLGFLPFLFSNPTACQTMDFVFHGHNCWLPRYHRVVLLPSAQLSASLLASPKQLTVHYLVKIYPGFSNWVS